jgi:radical SAM superfamily enzyme YgiQ (UPF0313 family)
MKVCFILPPDTHSIESSIPKRLEGGKGLYPKLGILYVAAYVEKQVPGIETSFIDCPALGLDYPGLARKLAAERPDLVALSTLTFNLIDAFKVIRTVKEASPETKVCVGGQHVNLYPQETLGLDGVDFVVAGEGERSFTWLIQALAAGASDAQLSAIPGLGWKRDGRTGFNPAVDKVPDLDELPFPARHLIDMGRYTHLIGKGKRIATLQSSRGCPAACLFCDIRLTKFRQRSPDSVLAEIRMLADEGFDDFFFVDDTITINRKRLRTLAQRLAKEGPRINFKISARVDTVDPELLDDLAAAGCYRIHFGVESATPRLLEYMEKGVQPERIEKAFRDTQAAGIGTYAYMMIGIPSETEAEMYNSVDFSIVLKAEYAQFSVCTPYPKTALYQRMLADGIVPEDYWMDFAKRPTEDFRIRFYNPDFNEEDLRRIQDECHRRFYARPGVMAREILRLKSWTDLKAKVRVGTSILLKQINR